MLLAVCASLLRAEVGKLTSCALPSTSPRGNDGPDYLATFMQEVAASFLSGDDDDGQTIHYIF